MRTIEAGLRKYAEATGRIPVRNEGKQEEEEEGYREVRFNNGPARIPGDDYGFGGGGGGGEDGDEEVEMVDAETVGNDDSESESHNSEGSSDEESDSE